MPAIQRALLLTGLLSASWSVWDQASAAPFAYIANHTSGNVSVIDTATNTVVATVSVPRAHGVAVSPSGTRVYVTDGCLGSTECSSTPGSTLTVLDTGTN